MTKRFAEAMRLMRRRDPQLREDGFWALKPHAAEHVDELIEAFHAEQDHGLRAWLFELIAEARDPKALPLLVRHLANEELRMYAVHGLKALNTKEARTALYRDRAN
ncbi:HEAT repeat domain-containing protein [Lentzea aerocolonigenes]|uniref:HEAT repeat domain-containing protein n=1 Tax=Lentzea aerocolonigenes TaxID=68170 RepID=UPI0004C36157|nr:HEAT repeat domain-containing protein [Lentzea aerocolonigenes]MCP2246162.1 hypothetical protein [Lentzea aerocolonigenes]